MSLKTLRNIIILITFLVISYGVGFKSGSGEWRIGVNRQTTVFSNETTSKTNFSLKKADVDLSLFWEVWERLSQNFLKKEALDSEKMVYGAISGMVSALNDPYTVFLTPSQNKETKEELGGSFTGIGAQLGLKEKYIVVIAPLAGTPAEKAGMKPGDYILEIDGKSTEKLTLREAVSKIRGPKGTKVKITILHEKESKPITLTLVRDTILVKSVEWQTLEQKSKSKDQRYKEIAYLKLSRFGDGTDAEWEAAVNEISIKYQEKSIKGLILDLRNNPGGYLAGAVYIASEFIPKGEVVVQQENAKGTKQSYLVEHEGKLLAIPLVVLINKGSASASEIVAGALKDYKRATLVGEKSFGKGSIQEAEDLPKGAGLHITTAKWLLPLGNWINEKGIEPDIKVSLDEKQPEVDTQLIKAGEEVEKLF